MNIPDVTMAVGRGEVHGDLVVPEDAVGVVVFAHGTGSGRHSPRNRAVAEHLQRAGLATMLMDLLTADEEAADEISREFRFDIRLLSRRLLGASLWLREHWKVRDMPHGYFGASTGAAAALTAAAEEPDWAEAVVARGGRPDLAQADLAYVSAPTLLIVGQLDTEVLRLNREAFKRLRGVKDLQVVGGASHLFEEPGALDEVARLAADWFRRHLVRPKEEE